MKRQKKSDEMARYGIKYCTVGDNCYPRVLRKIANRPAVLYYKGNITILNVINGLALGCDTAALKGALHNGGT